MYIKRFCAKVAPAILTQILNERMERSDEAAENKPTTNRLVKFGRVKVWNKEEGKSEFLSDNFLFEIGARKIFNVAQNECVELFSGCAFAVKFKMGKLIVDKENGDGELVVLVGSIPAVCKLGHFPRQPLELNTLQRYQDLVDEYAAQCGLRDRPDYFEKMRATSPPLMCAMCAPSLNSHSMAIFVLFSFTFFTLDDIFDNLTDFWKEILPISDLKDAVDSFIRVMCKDETSETLSTQYRTNNKFPLFKSMCKMLRLFRSKLDSFDPECVAQFVHATTDIFEAWTWEARMSLCRSPKDSAGSTLQKFYMEIRDITGGTPICVELISVFNEIKLPEAVRRDPLFKMTLIWVSRCVTLENDIFSFKKEMGCRETANAIWLRGRKVTLEQAFKDILKRTAQYVGDIQGLQMRLLRKFRREKDSLQAYFTVCNVFIDSGIQYYLLSHRYGSSGFSVKINIGDSQLPNE